LREILASGEVKASVVSYWELVLKKGRQTAPVLQPAAWWMLVAQAPTKDYSLVSGILGRYGAPVVWE